MKKSPTCFDATEQMSKQVEDFFFPILWPSHNVLTLAISRNLGMRLQKSFQPIVIYVVSCVAFFIIEYRMT